MERAFLIRGIILMACPVVFSGELGSQRSTTVFAEGEAMHAWPTEAATAFIPIPHSWHCSTGQKRDEIWQSVQEGRQKNWHCIQDRKGMAFFDWTIFCSLVFFFLPSLVIIDGRDACAFPFLFFYLLSSFFPHFVVSPRIKAGINGWMRQEQKVTHTQGTEDTAKSCIR